MSDIQEIVNERLRETEIGRAILQMELDKEVSASIVKAQEEERKEKLRTATAALDVPPLPYVPVNTITYQHPYVKLIKADYATSEPKKYIVCDHNPVNYTRLQRVQYDGNAQTLIDNATKILDTIDGFLSLEHYTRNGRSCFIIHTDIKYRCSYPSTIGGIPVHIVEETTGIISQY